MLWAKKKKRPSVSVDKSTIENSKHWKNNEDENDKSLWNASRRNETILKSQWMRIEADIDGQSFRLMWMLNYSFVGRVKWQKVGTNCDEDSNETCVQAKVVWVWNGVALEVAAAILSTHPHGQLFLLNTQNQMSIILCESAAAKTTTNMINSIHAVFFVSILCNGLT